MKRQELLRLLSISIIVLSVVVIVLSAVVRHYIGSALGAFVLLLGIVWYTLSTDASDEETEDADTPRFRVAVFYFAGWIAIYVLLGYLWAHVFQESTASIATVPESTRFGFAGVLLGGVLGWALPKATSDREGLHLVRRTGDNVPLVAFSLFLVSEPATSWLFACGHLGSRAIFVLEDSS